VNPLIYLIKTYEYRNSLHKLTRKLQISFTNKNIRKKSKVLVAFLSNQNIGWQQGHPTKNLFTEKNEPEVIILFCMNMLLLILMLLYF